MKTYRGIGGVVAVALGIGVGLPQQATAGRRERDTAIKILTGAAVVSAMHQAARRLPPPPLPPSPPLPRVRHTVTVQASSRHSAPRYTQHQTRHSAPRYTPHQTRQPSYRGRSSDRSPHYHRGSHRPVYHPPIIRLIDGRTRLYQPGIRGHQAFLQERCPHSGDWVTVGVHPSVW